MAQPKHSPAPKPSSAMTGKSAPSFKGNPTMSNAEFRAIMKRQGWNKPAVAELIGQGERNVAYYLAGTYKIPRAIVILMRLVDQGFLAREDALKV